MIREAPGDLLAADVDAVVNTVNTVRVMGKGIVLLDLADGFESAYGMELLATVHRAATHSNCADRECVVRAVRSWNQRKARMFTERPIDTALDRLYEQGWVDDSFPRN